MNRPAVPTDEDGRTAVTLGLELAGGDGERTLEPVVPAGTRPPETHTGEYAALRDVGRLLRVRLHRWPGDDASAAEPFATYELDLGDLPRRPRTELELTVELTADARVAVEARTDVGTIPVERVSDR